MEINGSYRLKDFLKLGFKKTQVQTVVRTSVFQGGKTGQGYAIEFNLNQAIFVLMGCELLWNGFSARHIEQVLFQLSGINFTERASTIRRNGSGILVFRSHAEDDHRRKIRRELRGIKETAAGQNIMTGEQILRFDEKLRSTPLTAMFIPGASEFETLRQGLSTYTWIDLRKVLAALTP